MSQEMEAASLKKLTDDMAHFGPNDPNFRAAQAELALRYARAIERQAVAAERAADAADRAATATEHYVKYTFWIALAAALATAGTWYAAIRLHQ